PCTSHPRFLRYEAWLSAGFKNKGTVLPTKASPLLFNNCPSPAMLGQVYQSGFISLLYSVGCVLWGRGCFPPNNPSRTNHHNSVATHRSPRPLQLCEKHEEVPGSIRRVLDEDVQSSVVELLADNLVYTWLRIPYGGHEQQQEPLLALPSLHIRLRHLVLVLKNLDQHVSLEVHVADDRGSRRRFRFSTFQKKSIVHSQLALLPLHLDSGWNQLQLDLDELMHSCYNVRYGHAISVQLHATCRVRRIYFAEKMYSEAQLPPEFRLFKRLSKGQMQRFREHDRQRRNTQASSK
ncbi:hypothetical protein F441_18178, partial [Phytophthora nicotianae CJ01A1]